jgi:hypothetical protein
MKLQVWGALALFLATTSLSHAAAVTPEQLASQYQTEGYSRVEVKFFGDRAEVEAIRDGVKIEVLYDLLTGNVLKRETERVDGDDNIRPGIYVREDRDDDRYDDDRYDDDHYDDDHHGGHHGGDDDYDDHHDDDYDDDGHHGGRHGGDDDHYDD